LTFNNGKKRLFSHQVAAQSMKIRVETVEDHTATWCQALCTFVYEFLKVWTIKRSRFTFWPTLQLPSPTAVAGVMVFTFVCLCVCLFFRTISQNPMQLGSPNLTHM